MPCGAFTDADKHDRALFDTWLAAWSALGHFEIIPVRTSAEAAWHIADKL